MHNQDFEKSVIKKYTNMGFNNLTEIQEKSYAKIAKGENVLLIAPTGSGKTEAAIIPTILDITKNSQKKKIQLLYITPLKSLNRDIFRRIIRYAESEDLRVEIRHGDTSRTQKRKMIEEPPELLITTPETLGILLTNKSSREILTEIKYVIIDEFHIYLSQQSFLKQFYGFSIFLQ